MSCCVRAVVVGAVVKGEEQQAHEAHKGKQCNRWIGSVMSRTRTCHVRRRLRRRKCKTRIKIH